MQNKFSQVRTRMLQIVEEQNISRSEISKKISKGRGFFDNPQMIFDPNFDAICAFLKIFSKIDANWLLFGEGNKLKNNQLGEHNNLCSQQSDLQNAENQKNCEKEVIALQSKIEVLKSIISDRDEVIADKCKEIGKLESVIDMLKDKKTTQALEFTPLSLENDLD